MEALTSFGAWLRLRRRALDLTQEELAARVGLSASAIRKIESDERRPSREVAELLADGLQVTGEERSAFLRAARGELSVSHSQTLATAIATPPPPPAPTVVAPAVTPSPTPAPVRRPTLPTPPTPLVGRINELLQINHLLRDPTCRLLTVVGPGGIGKTRVALEAALQQTGFADGVYFVPLASVSTPALVAPTIATAIGLQLQGTNEPHRQVIHHVQHKTMLLLLDNVEHLLTAPAAWPAGEDADITWLAELLNHAPGVKLLATSREPLSLPGEWLIDLYGLPVPPATVVAGRPPANGLPDALEKFSSVELFLQTARRIDTRFTLEPGDRAAVARICQLVDGLPLGIELAAAWVRTLSCTEIAEEIERNLDFLATPARGVPERHRSIAAVFDHSWRLLGEGERQALRRLSVFRGSFSREAADAVAGARLPVLSALVSKSLVRHNQQGRYDLHELVRQYAAAQLHTDPAEAQATQERHSRYFLNWLHQRGDWLRAAQQQIAVADFTAEADNIRAAWRWAVSQGNTATITAMTVELIDFYDWLSWFQEAEHAFLHAVQQLAGGWPLSPAFLADLPTALAGAIGCVLLGLGAFSARVGQYDQAQAALAHSSDLLRTLDDPRLLMRMYYWQTMVADHQGHYAEARQSAEAGLALAEQAGDRSMYARLLNLLGFVALFEGAYQQAQERFERALVAARALGNPNLTILLLNNLSSALRVQGQYEPSHALLQESLALAHTVGDRRLMAFAQGSLGQLAFELGNYADAQRWFHQSLALLREINEIWSMTGTLRDLGQTALALGQMAEAQRHFGEMLALAAQAKLAPRLVDALVGIAQLEMHEGDPVAALRLLNQVIQHPATQRESKDRAERLRAELPATLTAAQIDQAQACIDDLETVVAQYRNRYTKTLSGTSVTGAIR
jgi:predicted ATPase/DNA-binding XRE family transcriptional regulator